MVLDIRITPRGGRQRLPLDQLTPPARVTAPPKKRGPKPGTRLTHKKRVELIRQWRGG